MIKNSKTMKAIIIAAMLAVCVCAGAQTFSLQQCIDTALAHNNQLKQQTYRMKTQEVTYRQARQNLLPNLNASASQNWVFGRSIGADNVYQSTNSSQTSFGLSASLLLFDGLKMKYSIDEAKAAMLASEADVSALKADITMNISAIYLQILLNKELLETARQQLADTQLKVEQNRALVEAERLAAGELYAIEAQAAKEELAVTQAQNNLQLALLDMVQALELDSIEGFDVVVPTDVELLAGALLTNDAVYNMALQHRPEIKAAEYNLAASEHALKSAKADYYPTLSAGASLSTGYYDMAGYQNNTFGRQLGDNLSTSVGLQLTIPIFNKMQVKNNVSRARINVENYKVQAEETKKTLRKNIDQAYYNALAAQSRETAAEKSERSAYEAYRYAEQKYESGRASVYEFYDAKLSYTLALSERIQAKYEYLFRLKILEYYAQADSGV